MHSESDPLVAEKEKTEGDSSKWKKFKEDNHASKEGEVKEQPEPINLLEEENKSLKEALENKKTALLYAQAEVENTRRRSKRDIEAANQYAGTDILKSFIPILESIEAASTQDETVTLDQLREGSKNILALMHSTFRKLGVTEVSATIGETFNPNLHSAIGTESSKTSSNTIAKVLRKGYQLHTRVLQPAMVIVTKYEEPTEANKPADLEK